MKYILYWWFYISPLGGGDLNGTVVITDTHISSYMYNVGYIEWAIIEKDIVADDGKFVHGEFILKKDNINSVMKITEKKSVSFYPGE